MKSTIEKLVIALLVCIGSFMLYNNYISKQETVEDSKIISIREVDEKNSIVTLQVKTYID